MKKLLHLLVLLGMVSSAAVLMADNSCATQAADKAQLADDASSNLDDEEAEAGAEAEEAVSAEAAVSQSE